MSRGQRKVVWKVILCGDGFTGKTALRKRYMGQGFSFSYLSTIGADFSWAQETVDDTVYRLQIWDLAGQPSFKNVRSTFYEGAFGALLVYDITRRETFQNLENWIKELFVNTRQNGVPFVILGNKVDLREQGVECVPVEEAEEWVNKLNEKYADQHIRVTFLETSAKTGHNVREAFTELRKSINVWLDNQE